MQTAGKVAVGVGAIAATGGIIYAMWWWLQQQQGAGDIPPGEGGTDDPPAGDDPDQKTEPVEPGGDVNTVPYKCWNSLTYYGRTVGEARSKCPMCEYTCWNGIVYKGWTCDDARALCPDPWPVTLYVDPLEFSPPTQTFTFKAKYADGSIRVVSGADIKAMNAAMFTSAGKTFTTDANGKITISNIPNNVPAIAFNWHPTTYDMNAQASNPEAMCFRRALLWQGDQVTSYKPMGNYSDVVAYYAAQGWKSVYRQCSDKRMEGRSGGQLVKACPSLTVSLQNGSFSWNVGWPACKADGEKAYPGIVWTEADMPAVWCMVTGEKGSEKSPACAAYFESKAPVADEWMAILG